MNFSCVSCGLTLEATPDLSGQVVPCPGCGKELTVPQAKPRRSNVITSVADAEAAEAEAELEAEIAATPIPKSDAPTVARRRPALPQPGANPPIRSQDDYEDDDYDYEYDDPPRSSMLVKVIGFVAAIAAIAGAMWFFILRQPGGDGNSHSPFQLTDWYTPKALLVVGEDLSRGNLTPEDDHQLLITVFHIASDLLTGQEDSESPGSASVAVDLEDFRLFPENIDKAFKPEGGAPLLDSNHNAPFFVGQVPGMTSIGASADSLIDEFIEVRLFWSLPKEVLENGGEIEIQFRDLPPVILPDEPPEKDSDSDDRSSPLELPIGRVEQLFSAGDDVPRWEPDAGDQAVALSVRTRKHMSGQHFLVSECILRDAAGNSHPCAGIWLTNEIIVGGDTFTTPEPLLMRLVFGVPAGEKSFSLRYQGSSIGKVSLTPGTVSADPSGSITVQASSPEAAFSVLNEVGAMGDAIGLTGSFTQRWGEAAQDGAEESSAEMEQKRLIEEAKKRAEEALKPSLPDDFAFLPLTEWRPGSDLVEIERGDKKLIVAYLKGDEAVLAIGKDVVVGLQSGRHGLVVDQRMFSNGMIKNGLLMKGAVSYEGDDPPLTLTDGRIAIGDSTGGLGNPSTSAPAIGWKAESFVCLRGDKVLGTWDARAREFREARPSEQSAAKDALEAVETAFKLTIGELVAKADSRSRPSAPTPPPKPAKPSFPTEIRDWTDRSARKVRGRVMRYSPSDGTVQLELETSGKVVAFPIDRLSITDRDYILKLHGDDSR